MLGSTSFVVELPLHVVGREDDDHVGLLDRLGRREHAQALGLGLGARLRPLGQPDADVDAGVAQRQRVGVALAAVAEHRDVLALDQGEVGVVVVEHLSHSGLSFWWCGPQPVTAGGGTGIGTGRGVRSEMERVPRPMATMPDCTSSRMPNGSRTAQEVGQLVGVAGDLDGDGVGGDVDDLGPEQVHGVQHGAPAGHVGLDLHQQQLAVDRGRAVELDDLDHLDQLVELLGDLLERRLLDVDHDRHPGDVGVLGRPDREGVDVEAAPREQSRDPGQDAGLVLDEDAQGVRAHSSSWFACSSRASARVASCA